jgi:xanthine/CO dehydrogenase XdhC/CoxF family maturation factor
LSEARVIIEALLSAQQQGREVILATVIATRGSVPRHAGSKMIIDPATGGMIGTIGGGCGEADVIAAAREVASGGDARIFRVELTDSIDSFSPAVCGGTMNVFVERVTATKERS